ncbi:MAG: OstA-like protein [Paludibacter sp.]
MINIFSKIFISNIKYTVVFGVLLLLITTIQSQVPGQLRKEILNKQAGKTEAKPEKKANSPRERRKGKPLAPFKPLAPIVNPLNQKGVTLINLEKNDLAEVNEELHPDYIILRGNVLFRHENVLLYCDSAYYYQKANSLDAFSNVRIVQGDTLFVYSDFLFYDGNLKLARLRQHVKMENRKTTLTTDSLNYDRNTNLAYYYTGGKIVDPQNTLTSFWGQYNTVNDNAQFRNNVVLTNKNFVLNSDTLNYNTKTHIANIIGKTKIIYQNETDIFTKKGWYNTDNEQMMLLNRSLIVHKDGNTMLGDTIFYDKTKKIAEAFDNVILTDSTQKTTLTGNYVFYDETTEAGLATDSAVLLDWSTVDSMWVHADTLRTFSDSIYKVAKGYYNVRLFRNDVQGISDSLYFSTRDSVINMIGEPVLWSDNNQLSGEVIQAFTKDKKVDHIHVQRAAIAIQKVDSINYNQLSGKELIAYMDSGQLRRVHVSGNAETIFYPIDDGDSTIVGLNKTESSYVDMYFKNRKIERIVMKSATSGIMYPIGQLSGGDLYLRQFFWLAEQRPKNNKDILTKYAKVAREKIGTSSIMGMSTGSTEKNNRPKEISK